LNPKNFSPAIDRAREKSALFSQKKPNDERGILEIMNEKILRRILMMLIAAVLSATPLLAQTTAANLSGTVRDESDALVAGATVTVNNAATGFKRAVVTDSDGAFFVPQIPPNTYSVKVEREGFAATEITDVILNVNDQRALNIRLKVGEVGASVVVNAEQTTINESSSSATVIDRNFVENLPLNGRSFQSLIALSPGVVLNRSSSSDAGQFSVNGQRANSNYFTVDGISGNFGASASSSTGVASQSPSGSLPATNAVGGFSNLVPLDALQEFKITTSNASADSGRTPGAQVSLSTRSGTNELHGTLFHYLRNDALDANDWFFNRDGITAPLRQNNFGGSIGGPVFLPRFGEGGKAFYDGRNRSFFFVAYEGTRLVLPQTGSCVNVPTAARRNSAPANLRPALDLFPLPNRSTVCTGATPANPNVLGFVAGYSNPAQTDSLSVRLDHKLNSKINLFGLLVYSPSSSEQRGSGGIAPSVVTTTKRDSRFLTIGSTQILTSKIVNDIRFNTSQSEGNSNNRLDNFGGATPPDSSIFLPSFTGANLENGSVIVGVTGAPLAAFGNTAANKQRQINITDNLSVIAGAHQLRFGADYRRLTPFQGVTVLTTSYLFNFTAGANPQPNLFSLNLSANEQYELLFTNFSLYAADTWKVNKRLTLDYGLRWDVNPAPKALGGKELLTVLDPRNPQLAPAGTPVYKTTYNNFAPRVGAAYLLNDKQGWETVLRGGFGVFNDLGQGTLGQIRFPFERTTPLTGANLVFPLTPQGFALLPAPNAVPSATNRAILTTADPNLKLPLSYQFNLTVDQTIGKDQVLSVAYVGNRGRRLIRSESYVYAAPNPFNRVTILRNAGESQYDSMQIQFARRLSRGLQALASYTWAHAIDTGSNDSSTGIPLALADPNADRGNSNFDVRHSFNGAISYQIPVPKNFNGFSRAILGGWSIDAIATARTALPVDIIIGAAPTAAGFSTNFRPNLVPGVPLYIFDENLPGGKRFNPAAFTIARDPNNPNNATNQIQGNLGRNALRGFGAKQIDLAVHRSFGITETVKLKFRAEFFNVFNIPNFGDPGSQGDGGSRLFSNTTTGALNTGFGISTQTLGRSLGGGIGGGFNPLYQVGGPRSIQLAVKLVF
jgi:hypothetical protein